jgi:WD40 repeat protein
VTETPNELAAANSRVEQALRSSPGAGHSFRAAAEVRVEKIKVLLFAANPRGTAPLDLSREFREIDEEVRLSTFRNAVELILVPGTRPVDLLRKLNENQPQVVHFSSHGNPDEIILESGEQEAEDSGFAIPSTRSADERDMTKVRPDEVEIAGFGQGEHQAVSKSALVHLLRSCNEGNLRLVVLNACSTRTQAEALTEIVDCVVSMNRTITDRAAIKFAASFYGALAFGRSVQKAFEQGVARLSAEGITEVDTPELIVRSGVDAARVVLVGSARRKDSTPAPEAPFIVPFPRNPDFVGREGDLARLHTALAGAESGPVGIRPAGLTGMGGIGKTQLAVEYVYRYREKYPGGIFWVNAADSLTHGLAHVGSKVRPDVRSESSERQVQVAFEELNRRPDALLVFDNLENPGQLARPVGSEGIPLNLAPRILFTTRHRELGRFNAVEVSVLPEAPALMLLLRHESRQTIRDDANHPERREAVAICRLLGWLPLALELAGAFLGEWPGISLADYRTRLQAEGCLPTLDTEVPNHALVNFQPIHEAAVAATLKTQWDALKQTDESARLVLRVAGQFAEAASISTSALGLFAGVLDTQKPAVPSPLRRALKRLHDVRLVEDLVEHRVRLHPLVREFAELLTPREDTQEFRHSCARRIAEAFDDLTTLEEIVRTDGPEGLHLALATTLDFASESPDGVRSYLRSVLRVLHREFHHLRDWNDALEPNGFAQQFLFRALTLAETRLAESAERRLTELAHPALVLRWRTVGESPALARILTEHQGEVTSVAVSPDGRRIVSGSKDSTLVVWDLEAGAPIHRLVGHRDWVRCVAVSPDGRRIVSGSDDKTVAIWDVGTGTQINQLTGHQGWVGSVAVSPDGRRIVSGSSDKTVAIWDIESATQISRLTGHQGRVRCVAVSPDGRRIVSGSSDKTVAIWDIESATQISRLTGHQGRVRCVAVSPDGRRIISGSDDGTVVVWDIESATQINRLAGHEGWVSSVSVSPDGRRIVSASDDGTVGVWDFEFATQVDRLTGHHAGVSSVAISPDGHRIVSGSDDNAIAIWDLEGATEIHRRTGHQGRVRCVAVSPDGRRVASGSSDATVMIWDFESGTPIHRLIGHQGRVWSVAVSPDGRRIVSGSDDGTVAIWDLETGTQINRLTARQGWVSSVAVSPDGRRIVSAGCFDCTVAVWDSETGAQVHCLTGHQEAVNAVAVSPDGRWIASGSSDKTVVVWDLETGMPIHHLTGHRAPVWSVSVSPDGRHIASGSADATVVVWDLEASTRIHRLTGHRAPVWSVAVSPDGRRIASGSADATVVVWDLDSGQRSATLALDGMIPCVTWDRGSRFVLAGDTGGNIYRLEYREY